MNITLWAMGAFLYYASLLMAFGIIFNVACDVDIGHCSGQCGESVLSIRALSGASIFQAVTSRKILVRHGLLSPNPTIVNLLTSIFLISRENSPLPDF